MMASEKVSGFCPLNALRFLEFRMQGVLVAVFARGIEIQFNRWQSMQQRSLVSFILEKTKLSPQQAQYDQ